MPRVSQTSFSRGEVSPDLLGRVDLVDYAISLKTARNMEILQRGGARNRPGLKYLAPVFKHDKKVRLIPFVFGETDTHLLEFGDGYIRVLRNDAHILESSVNISGVTRADPGVVTTAANHGLSTGDEVFIAGVAGMTQINNNRYKITKTGSDRFELNSQIDGSGIDTTAYTAYGSGGTVSKVLTIESPYSDDELQSIKYRQSFDVLFLTHPNHPPKQLVRNSLASWTLEDIEFFPEQDPPEDCEVSANSTDTATVRYAVTAINKDTFEESAAALPKSGSHTITNITKANPAVVTISGAAGELETGHEVEIDGVGGMTELNGSRFTVIRNSGTKFELQGVDSSGFAAYTTGGTLTPAFATVTDSYASDSTDLDNTVSWEPSAGAIKYVVYREQNGVFGFVGETRNTQFDDKGSVAPDLSDTVSIYRNPFFAAGDYPRSIGGHEQRNVYAGSDNGPATLEFSQSGGFNNFSQSSPRKDTDAFRVTLAANSREIIRHLAAAQDLIVFTNVSVRRITSGDQAFTFANIRVKGSDANSVGASQAVPLRVGRKMLFEDALGGKIYATEFSFTIDDLDTKEISILSNHLLANDRIFDWCRVGSPEPVIYAAMESGKALAITYNEETDSVQIAAFCRWDTKGFFDSVAAVRAGVDDNFEVPYFVVTRTIGGKDVKYIEKGGNREDKPDVRDALFLDSAAEFEDRKTVTAVSGASQAVFTSNGHGLENGQVVEASGFEWESSFDKNFNEVFPDDLNNLRFKVRNKTANTFKLESINTGNMVDGSELPAFKGIGYVYRTVTELDGFEHLAGETVVGLIDGNVVRNISVNSLGEVTLDRRAARIKLGIPYISDLETFPLVSPSTGAGSGSFSSIRQVFVRLKDSRGMLIGPDSDNLREWKQRQFEKYGEPTRLFSGVIKLHPAGQWDRDASVFIRQKDPLPLTILEVTPDVKVSTG